MNVSTITSITPNGKPYESQYGLLYPFLVAFEDNTSGTVNTKTAQPPYKVGDRVGYEITGDFRGVSKLKISKNPDKAFGGTPPPQVQPPHQPQAQPRQAVPALPPGTDFDVGMRAQANLYVESCLWATRVNEKLDALGMPSMSPDHFQACVASLYIQANKLGLVVPSQASNARKSQGNPPSARPDSHPDFDPAQEPAPF